MIRSINTDARRVRFLRRIWQAIAPAGYTREAVVKAIADSPETLSRLSALVRDVEQLTTPVQPVHTFAVRVPDPFRIGPGFVMPAFGRTADEALDNLRQAFPQCADELAVLREFDTLVEFHKAEERGEFR